MKTAHLMPYCEISGLWSEIRTKLTNIHCLGRMWKFLY